MTTSRFLMMSACAVALSACSDGMEGDRSAIKVHNAGMTQQQMIEQEAELMAPAAPERAQAQDEISSINMKTSSEEDMMTGAEEEMVTADSGMVAEGEADMMETQSYEAPASPYEEPATPAPAPVDEPAEPAVTETYIHEETTTVTPTDEGTVVTHSETDMVIEPEMPEENLVYEDDPAVNKDVQQFLKDAGYYNGAVSEKMNAEALNALTKYQTEKGLPVGGPNGPTLKAMGII